MEAVIAGCKAGLLRRALYFQVANEPGKNLKDCLRRVDGVEVRTHGASRHDGGRTRQIATWERMRRA